VNSVPGIINIRAINEQQLYTIFSVQQRTFRLKNKLSALTKDKIAKKMNDSSFIIKDEYVQRDKALYC